MTREDIASVVRAFGKAAADAFEIGFDGVEIHGAHGYLIDQFFWDRTNRRTDEYGGGIRERTRLATEVIRECRRCTSPDFPISFRFSQWKQADYEARLANDPFEFETFLLPLVEAGVDIFHCSTRRYWESAFAGSPLTLAGWTRKITDKTTIAVGSVGLDRAHETKGLEAQARYEARPASLERLLEMLDRKEFDLAAVGRAILIDPAWVHKVRVGAFDELRPYSTELRNIMY
jgi:2,4-dienoyl-CoA reductase-like NADH-dependent reductase (Old Yellow Enzyme family)